MKKQYKVTRTYSRTGGTSSITGTIEELVDSYSYTLDVGRSWQHEKGNPKINCNPKMIASLITNLNNAVNNAAANGYAGVTYTSQVVDMAPAWCYNALTQQGTLNASSH